MQVKTNSTACVTPPASENGSDVSFASCLDPADDQKPQKKRNRRKVVEEASNIPKKPRNSLIDHYLCKQEKNPTEPKQNESEAKSEEVEYEVESIISMKRSQVSLHCCRRR